MAQAAMEDAVAHANTRMAFGTNIGSFQQIEQMLVDMEVKLVNMRNMVYRAAWDLDHSAEGKRLSVALMKRYVPAAATEVVSDALQIFEHHLTDPPYATLTILTFRFRATIAGAGVVAGVALTDALTTATSLQHPAGTSTVVSPLTCQNASATVGVAVAIVSGRT